MSSAVDAKSRAVPLPGSALAVGESEGEVLDGDGDSPRLPAADAAGDAGEAQAESSNAVAAAAAASAEAPVVTATKDPLDVLVSETGVGAEAPSQELAQGWFVVQAVSRFQPEHDSEMAMDVGEVLQARFHSARGSWMYGRRPGGGDEGLIPRTFLVFPVFGPSISDLLRLQEADPRHRALVDASAPSLTTYMAGRGRGNSIVAAMLGAGTAPIPHVLQVLTEAFWKARGWEARGVFRTSSDPDRLRALKRQLNRNKYVVLEDDPYVIADLIKIWLRSLKYPVIPNGLYDEALTCSSVDAVHELLERLPASHAAVARHVGQLLRNLLEYTDSTEMDIESLATMFAPNLFRSPLTDLKAIMKNSMKEKSFVRHLTIAFSFSDPAPSDEKFGRRKTMQIKRSSGRVGYGDRSNTSSLADHFSGVSGERSSTDSGTADGVSTPTGRTARAGSRAHPGHKTYGHGTLKPLRVSGLIQASSRGGGRGGAKKKVGAASPSDDDSLVSRAERISRGSWASIDDLMQALEGDLGGVDAGASAPDASVVGASSASSSEVAAGPASPELSEGASADSDGEGSNGEGSNGGGKSRRGKRSASGAMLSLRRKVASGSVRVTKKLSAVLNGGDRRDSLPIDDGLPPVLDEPDEDGVKRMYTPFDRLYDEFKPVSEEAVVVDASAEVFFDSKGRVRSLSVVSEDDGSDPLKGLLAQLEAEERAEAARDNSSGGGIIRPVFSPAVSSPLATVDDSPSDDDDDDDDSVGDPFDDDDDDDDGSSSGDAPDAPLPLAGAVAMDAINGAALEGQGVAALAAAVRERDARIARIEAELTRLEAVAAKYNAMVERVAELEDENARISSQLTELLPPKPARPSRLLRGNDGQ